MRIIRACYCGGAIVVADIEHDNIVTRYHEGNLDVIVNDKNLDLANIQIKLNELSISELPSYVSELLSTDRYVDHVKVIDLRGMQYHGGTTLSSGAVPKWDFDDTRGFIKVGSVSSIGKWCTDAWHESYVMDLFENTGARIAKAVPAYAFL